MGWAGRERNFDKRSKNGGEEARGKVDRIDGQRMSDNNDNDDGRTDGRTSINSGLGREGKKLRQETKYKRQETKMGEKRRKRREGKWIKSKHQDDDDNDDERTDDDDDDGRTDGRTDGWSDPKGVHRGLQSQW